MFKLDGDKTWIVLFDEKHLNDPKYLKWFYEEK